MKNLAYRLAEARKNKHLTQAQVADKLHLTTQAVSSWECGNTMPDTEKIPEIAAIYDVSADWLLSGKIPSEEILEATSNLSERLFNETRMATYVSAYCTARHLYQAKRALAFAKEKHDGQIWKTKGGQEQIPYIYHPLMITCHALALGLDEDDLLSACLLHDVCEDCGVTPEELPVNDRTREAVRLLTKPEGYRNTEEEKKAYYDGIAGDRIAMIVKLLDRCINVSSMANVFTDERMAEYINETRRYLYPFYDKIRHEYPEYSNQMFLIRYHMNSVIDALGHHMVSAGRV